MPEGKARKVVAIPAPVEEKIEKDSEGEEELVRGRKS